MGESGSKCLHESQEGELRRRGGSTDGEDDLRTELRQTAEPALQHDHVGVNAAVNLFEVLLVYRKGG